MDILSHALWTNLVFKGLPADQKHMAIFFGVLPDFLSFTRLVGKDFWMKTMSFSELALSRIPKIVFKTYNLTHSLVIWVGIFILLKIINLDWLAIAFCGWGLHIMLDIFTHTRKFFPTPILWPFSDFHFSGIQWSNKFFMLFNYSVLTFLYLVFYF